MLRRFFWLRCLVVVLAVVLVVMLQSSTALAAAVDKYVVRYLHVTESIALEVNGKGETRPFSPSDISLGKQLFETNCLNCHVGGATLPDPLVSLSLTKLKGANPPRDNINNLVAYLRQPMTYDGSQETYWCRQVPESWMSQGASGKLSGFHSNGSAKGSWLGSRNFLKTGSVVGGRTAMASLAIATFLTKNWYL